MLRDALDRNGHQRRTDVSLRSSDRATDWPAGRPVRSDQFSMAAAVGGGVCSVQIPPSLRALPSDLLTGDERASFG
jgi:hypothetical protein